MYWIRYCLWFQGHLGSWNVCFKDKCGLLFCLRKVSGMLGSLLQFVDNDLHLSLSPGQLPNMQEALASSAPTKDKTKQSNMNHTLNAKHQKTLIIFGWRVCWGWKPGSLWMLVSALALSHAPGPQCFQAMLGIEPFLGLPALIQRSPVLSSGAFCTCVCIASVYGFF